MATGIGEALRRARREQQRTLADAAEATRIRESHLAALEEEHFDALGGDVYARGHLRAYAKYLGLDPDPLLAAYPRPSAAAPGAGEAPPAARRDARPVRPSHTRVRPTAAGVIVAILLAALAVAVIGSIVFSRGEDPEPAPPGSDDAAPAPTEVLKAGAVEVEFRVSGGESWIRVVVDGAVEVESVQPDGAQRSFRATREVILRSADAGVVFVTVNGEDHGPMGDRAELVERAYRAGRSS